MIATIAPFGGIIAMERAASTTLRNGLKAIRERKRMNDFDLKKLGTLRLCGGGALVALATWGVWAFCGGNWTGTDGLETAFDGWYYGREDQKTASAALAAAGLDEWSWDADGRLLVPKNKKNEYQTALAEAGAYPKAPSESRRDAIREMGAFESEAKRRMRELDACAFQLERTLERAGGIEYATVGVRERREQTGLTVKTVVTASIGVACREGCELDSNLLSAITVAAKHQLGVDTNENVSIIDLKAGKSYFGSEKSVGNGAELALTTEKERVEFYWRDKLEKTFDYMGGARVSVVAELVSIAPNDVVETKLCDDFVDFNDACAVALPEKDDDSRKSGGLGGLNGWGKANAWKGDANARDFLQGRATSAAERLAQVEIEEIGEPRPLATLEGNVRPSARTGGAFARLGNPVATRNAARIPAAVPAQNLAEVEKKTDGNGVLAVGAIERRDRKRGVALASYQTTSENGEDASDAENTQVESDEQNSSTPVERIARVVGEGQTGNKNETNSRDEKNGEKIGEKESKLNGAKERNVGNDERVRFRVRALAVRIGTPRGYVRRVARHLKAENAAETFAVDGETNDWDAYYQEAERKIVAETKNVALLLLRPLAERNGWSENELARSVSVDVYADPDDFDALNVGANGETPRGDDGKNENGPFEVVANFGQVANVAEMVAEVAEETRGDAETLEDASERETENAETTNFWAAWRERTRQVDAKTAAGVGGVLLLTFLAIVAPTTRRRGKRGDEETEKKTDDGKRTVAREKQNKRKKAFAQSEENAQENELAANAKGKRNKASVDVEENAQDAQNKQRARYAAAREEIRGGREDGVELRNETSPGKMKSDSVKTTIENDGLDDADEFDDWDDLDDDLLEIRTLIERERARVDDEPTNKRTVLRRESSETRESSERTARSFGDAARRREALELIARNPEQAAESLRRWLRPGA